MTASVVFLTPFGALALLAVVVPLAALAEALRRERRGRELLGLRPPARGSRVGRVAALAAVPLLLGLAATQPALRSATEVRVRTDAQALFVVDVSRSMLATPGFGKPTRFERARDAAIRLRGALPEIPSGVATMTDRVLPSLLPRPEVGVFDHTILRTLAIEQPPPGSTGIQSSTLGSLVAVGMQNYFPPSARRRLLVVLTDGESRPFDPRAVARALASGPGIRTVFVHVGSPTERVFGFSGGIELGYRSDGTAGETLARLASATGGSVFGEGSLGAAASAAQTALGSGPTSLRSRAVRTRTLAPYVALGALLPLLLLLGVPVPRWLRRSSAALAAGGLLILVLVPGRAAAAVPGTFAQAGDRALATLLGVFYAGEGRWRQCDRPACPTGNQDWGVDSLTYALYLRWLTAHDPAVPPVMRELLQAAPTYGPCLGNQCGNWSDVPEWDAIAALREYEVTGDARALAKAKAAFDAVEQASVYSLGACPQIRYQQPHGSANRLKTLETDANAIKAALLLRRATGDAAYLDSAVRTYASVRRFFLDPVVPLYSVYVFDDGTTCTQVPHRFFASVNGDMIWSGLELARVTHDGRYLREALATARAVSSRLADPAGVFAALQAENDIVEPLVEAMYALATRAHAGFARRWILLNAAAAGGARSATGAYGRFFDGPAPAGTTTAWQANGGLALALAAAGLAPAGRLPAAGRWRRARFVRHRVAALPASLTFRGSGIAFVGTLGQVCCEAGHARVFVDGRETFDRTGIWQNKSSLGRSLPGTVLFAWRWPTRGTHTIRFASGVANAKEGGPFLDLRGYVLLPR